MRRTLVLLGLIPLVAGCRKAPSPQEPADADTVAQVGEGDEQGSADGGAADDEGAANEGGDEGEGRETGGLPGPALPDGPLCDTHADCGEGMLCEGVGCEPGEGRCVSENRMCTRDLAQYCGCDGETFGASGTCPGDRYVYRGPCDPKLADGEACTDGRQCSSGSCAGEGLEGCSRADQGVCGSVVCTDDLATYCGCNNTQFEGSGTCPNQQFAYRGPCEGL